MSNNTNISSISTVVSTNSNTTDNTQFLSIEEIKKLYEVQRSGTLRGPGGWQQPISTQPPWNTLPTNKPLAPFDYKSAEESWIQEQLDRRRSELNMHKIVNIGDGFIIAGHAPYTFDNDTWMFMFDGSTLDTLSKVDSLFYSVDGTVGGISTYTIEDRTTLGSRVLILTRRAI